LFAEAAEPVEDSDATLDCGVVAASAGHANATHIAAGTSAVHFMDFYLVSATSAHGGNAISRFRFLPHAVFAGLGSFLAIPPKVGKPNSNCLHQLWLFVPVVLVNWLGADC
jgi:hypothetical protein